VSTETTTVDDTDDTTFYNLPAHAIEVGMSTADGQDVVEATPTEDGWVLVEVYTPRSDDPDQDAQNRDEPETRIHRAHEVIGMATFSDTDVDGSSHELARQEPTA
jgi:hypothetical protein